MKESISCILLLLLAAIVMFFEAWIVQLLWNWLAPVFWTAAPILTYWQAFGITTLVNIIGSIIRSI